MHFKPGDRVIYKAQKWGSHPGRSARNVRPAARGDSYNYQVCKFWIVEDVADGRIVVRTRRGKRREVAIDDPRLRVASFLEQVFYKRRFPIGV